MERTLFRLLRCCWCLLVDELSASSSVARRFTDPGPRLDVVGLLPLTPGGEDAIGGEWAELSPRGAEREEWPPWAR